MRFSQTINTRDFGTFIPLKSEINSQGPGKQQQKKDKIGSKRHPIRQVRSLKNREKGTNCL